MAGASTADVALASGEHYARVEALAADSAIDVAVLKIPGYGLPALQAAAAIPEVGARIVVIGSPLGLARTVSEGIVSATRLLDGRQLVQISAPISPGSSGGPVLNDRGEVVAITALQLKGGQNLNFAVPVRYAMGLVLAASETKPLARFFGRSGPGAAPGPATTALAPQAPPPIASKPRPTLEGAYSFVQTSSDSGSGQAGPSQQGVLFLADRFNVGLWVSRLADAVQDTSRRHIAGVSSMVTSPDGRFALSFGPNWVYDGYQTEDGLYATTSFTGRDGARITSQLRARRTDIELTKPYGLYDLTGHTDYYVAERSSSQVMDWYGRAAVATYRDSIWVDLYLVDEAGSDTGGYFVGPVRNGATFALESERGSKLSGTLRPGQMYLHWVDPRGNGSRLEGDFVATRR
jgi:hypothetical protein